MIVNSVHTQFLKGKCFLGNKYKHLDIYENLASCVGVKWVGPLHFSATSRPDDRSPDHKNPSLSDPYYRLFS